MKTLIQTVIITLFSAGLSFAGIPGTKLKRGNYAIPSTLSASDYSEKTVIVKVKPEYRSIADINGIANGHLNSILTAIGGTIAKKFPRKFTPRNATNDYGVAYTDLSTIYEVVYTDDIPLNEVIDAIFSVGIFKYVEPHFIPKALYTPDDPKLNGQYYLDMIKAYDAWDVQKGDSTVVIAIVDTGVDIDHSDLSGNVKKNYNDPIDGTDNDGDGYIDNFTGWDLGEENNDPRPTAGGNHGTWVSGCAAAEADNADGGAGTSFNSKIMPVKVSNASGYLTKAYEGIIYAADMGCDIINCSWGSAGGYSSFGEDVVAYATINKDALVIAAAGNSNDDGIFYPASYDYVISVAGTDENDEKWTFNATNGSNYNEFVDLCAPAKAIWTTFQGNKFIKIGGGTSFSSPQVAGVAALVKSKFPNYTALQISAQLVSTADNIDGVGGNGAYAGQLGGRLNAFRAVTETGHSFIQKDVFSHGDGSLLPGDTIELSVNLINLLAATSGVSAQISSANTNVTILDANAQYGSISTLESKQSIAPFKFIVGGGATVNEAVIFNLDITDGVSSWTDLVSIRINRDYVDVNINEITTSITNYGKIGYNVNNYGEGFKYNGSSTLIYEMGLMIGVDNTKVSASRDFEFYNFNNLDAFKPGVESDFDVTSVYDDVWAWANTLNVDVRQKTMAWNEPGHSKYIIVEYCIKNKDASDLVDAYVGLYSDFDIGNADNNIAEFNTSKKLGYVHEDGGGVHAGVQLLSNWNINYAPINNDGSAGGINIVDGFTSDEQYTALSSGLTTLSSNVGDVSNMVSAGPLTIPAGDSTWVAFALLAGDDLSQIDDAATNALKRYKELRAAKISVESLSNISCAGLNNGELEVKIEGGKEPYIIDWSNFPGSSDLAQTNLGPGIYQLTVTDKMQFQSTTSLFINEPFELEMSVLDVQDAKCYGELGSALISVSGGTQGYNYVWSDPSIPGVPNPSLKAGAYGITIRDANGCETSDSIEIMEPTELVSSMKTFENDSTGNCLGSATVMASGGVLPLTYSWDDPAMQGLPTAIDLCEGDYQVFVNDANGCETTAMVTIEGKPNFNSIDNVEDDGFATFAYPNPANSFLFIEYDLLENESVDLALYSISGQRVKEILTEEQSAGHYKVLVYTDNLSTGIYYYKLTTSNSQIAGKIKIDQ